MASLRIEYAHGQTELIGLERPEAVIGRDAGCDIPLLDSVTSRRHARIYQDSYGHFWIQDLQSKNGTLLNDKRVVTARLADGDSIGIGACRLTFQLDREPGIVLTDSPVDTQPAATSAWGAQQRLDLSHKRLERLYELNARLTGKFDRDELLGEVLDICVEELRFERAGIGVWPGPAGPLKWVRTHLARGPEAGEFRISRTLLDRTLRTAERILITDTADDAVDPTESMISAHVRSAMCVPMEYLQEVRGVVYGDRITSIGGYDREDLDFFAALGRLGAMALANVQLVEERQQRQRVEIQLQWARQIQARLFPAEPLVMDKLHIDALNEPGQKVSGDYYDFFKRPDGRVALAIADVSGKGVPASLLMANLQAGVHLILPDENDLALAVKRLNALICRNVADTKFITAFFGVLDPTTRRLQHVNAGHHCPYLVRPGRPAELLSIEPGLPLGVEPAFDYQSDILELPAEAASLFFYTDGVPEAQNEAGEFFGMDRLATALQSDRSLSPEDLLTRVQRSVKQFIRNQPPSDDVTMLVVRLDSRS